MTDCGIPGWLHALFDLVGIVAVIVVTLVGVIIMALVYRQGRAAPPA